MKCGKCGKTIKGSAFDVARVDSNGWFFLCEKCGHRGESSRNPIEAMESFEKKVQRDEETKQA